MYKVLIFFVLSFSLLFSQDSSSIAKEFQKTYPKLEKTQFNFNLDTLLANKFQPVYYRGFYIANLQDLDNLKQNFSRFGVFFGSSYSANWAGDVELGIALNSNDVIRNGIESKKTRFNLIYNHKYFPSGTKDGRIYFGVSGGLNTMWFNWTDSAVKSNSNIIQRSDKLSGFDFASTIGTYLVKQNSWDLLFSLRAGIMPYLSTTREFIDNTHIPYTEYVMAKISLIYGKPSKIYKKHPHRY